MPEFDPHAVIKELAEARLRCAGGAVAFESEPDKQWLCGHKEHGYEGFYAPFASLQVECQQIHSKRTGWLGDNIRDTLAAVGIASATCEEVGCPGWVPVSDVRVACWEVWKLLPIEWKQDVSDLSSSIDGADSFEEAVLRAAQAWVKEQHERKK